MSLRRLAALVEDERIRLGLPVDPESGALPVTSHDARRQPVDVIDEITVQQEEATAIRALLVDKDPAHLDLACRWAQEWVDALTAQNRPRALLQARRLLVSCLAAAERYDEAKATLTTIAAQCAQLGMVRYLLDGGPHVVAALAQLRADQQAGRWRPEWPEVPADFLERLVNAEAVQRV
jgi:serine/threonine-protein kinase PknK